MISLRGNCICEIWWHLIFNKFISFIAFIWVSIETQTCSWEASFSDSQTEVPPECRGEDAGVGADLHCDIIRLLHHPSRPSINHVFSFAERQSRIPNIPGSFQQSGAAQLCPQFLHLLPLQRRDQASFRLDLPLVPPERNQAWWSHCLVAPLALHLQTWSLNSFFQDCLIFPHWLLALGGNLGILK